MSSLLARQMRQSTTISEGQGVLDPSMETPYHGEEVEIFQYSIAGIIKIEDCQKFSVYLVNIIQQNMILKAMKEITAKPDIFRGAVFVLKHVKVESMIWIKAL